MGSYQTWTGNRLTLANVAPQQFAVTTKDNHLTLLPKSASDHHIELGKTAVITLTVAEPAVFTSMTIHQLNGTLQINNLTTQRLAIDHVNGTTNADHPPSLRVVISTNKRNLR